MEVWGRGSVLGKSHHLSALVDQQPAEPKRGTGSQSWSQDTTRFVTLVGDAQAQRVLQRSVKMRARPPGPICLFSTNARPAARGVQR
jgi:hypothetical protein